jgi:multiple sugar transport system substrate-binding protein
MDALKFSICKDANDWREPHDSTLAQFNQPIEIQYVPWDNYKQEMTAMALYGQGVDVSQTGAPVVNDLIAMNALRPFSDSEISSFGGASAFAPVAWSRMFGTEGRTYAVPLIVDPRVIIYWRDMLEDAGIDETTAFTSFENMEQTFEKLLGNGVATPWAVATADKLNAFQTACTWIWGNGGEIGKDDEYLFDRPEVIDGLTRYFSLYRYMPQTGQNPDATEIGSWFYERKIAVLISNPPTIRGTPPNMTAKLGVALAPGPTYVGGSSLIVWNNSRQSNDAVALVRYLTSHEAQMHYARQRLFLPTRTSVLNDEFFKDDPLMSVFVQSVLQGRTYANLRLSGLIEDMLANVIGNVWNKIIANPRTDVKSSLISEIGPVARRVNLWLE